MGKEEVVHHMVGVETHNLVEISKQDRASTGIIVKVVEYEVDNYATNVAVVVYTT